MNTTTKAFEMFTDASGAPALIQAGPCTWSLNCLGKVTYHAHGGQSGTPRALRAASARVAVAAYESMLGAEWRDRNRAMYADLAAIYGAAAPFAVVSASRSILQAGPSGIAEAIATQAAEVRACRG